LILGCTSEPTFFAKMVAVIAGGGQCNKESVLFYAYLLPD
jgi:hypothetical protein